MQTRTRDRADRSLEEARRRFERWRQGCRGYGRIPHELCHLAAETAAVHGPEVTASRLQLDVGRLKHWMRSSGHGDNATVPPQFIELAPWVADCTPACAAQRVGAAGGDV